MTDTLLSPLTSVSSEKSTQAFISGSNNSAAATGIYRLQLWSVVRKHDTLVDMPTSQSSIFAGLCRFKRPCSHSNFGIRKSYCEAWEMVTFRSCTLWTVKSEICNTNSLKTWGIRNHGNNKSKPASSCFIASVHVAAQQSVYLSVILSVKVMTISSFACILSFCMCFHEVQCVRLSGSS